jgi:hypothetical protein
MEHRSKRRMRISSASAHCHDFARSFGGEPSTSEIRIFVVEPRLQAVLGHRQRPQPPLVAA